MTGLAMTALVVRDEHCGISQSAVGACPSGGSANGGRSTTWLLEGLDVETCPSLRTSVQPGSTGFCETLLPEVSIYNSFILHHRQGFVKP